MRQALSYIARIGGSSKGGRADEDAQIPVPAGVSSRTGFGVARGRRELAQSLDGGRSGGSGEPLGPAVVSESEVVSRSRQRLGVIAMSPGEQRIYQIGRSLFRVWVDRPSAGADFFKAGEWVSTPIPCGSILGDPRAVPLTQVEADRLGLT